jgi:hypothetical protein
MSIKDDALEALSKGIFEVFESVGSEIGEIEEISQGFDMGDWRAYRIAQAAALAVPSLAGAISYIVVPLEIIALLRFLRNSALGTGFILNGAASPLDFPAIFAFAAERPDINDQMIKELQVKAQILAGSAALSTLGPKVAANLIASAITTQMALMAHHTIAPVAAKKMSAMLAKFLLPAGLSRWIPAIGAIVSATVNGVITNMILDAAVDYYGVVRRVGGR